MTSHEKNIWRMCGKKLKHKKMLRWQKVCFGKVCTYPLAFGNRCVNKIYVWPQGPYVRCRALEKAHFLPILTFLATQPEYIGNQPTKHPSPPPTLNNQLEKTSWQTIVTKISYTWTTSDFTIKRVHKILRKIIFILILNIKLDLKNKLFLCMIPWP